MAALPSIVPSYQAQKASAPRIKAVAFGDGYSQRLKWGLNIDAKMWNLNWQNISESDADTLETFFQARADDGASFDWEPLDVAAGTTYKFIFLSWSNTIPFKNRATFQAAFQQVFEP